MTSREKQVKFLSYEKAIFEIVKMSKDRRRINLKVVNIGNVKRSGKQLALKSHKNNLDKNYDGNKQEQTNRKINWTFEYKQREKMQDFKKIGERHERMKLASTRDMCLLVEEVRVNLLLNSKF